MWWKKKPDLRMINPSSKISLKLSCLASCKGDIEQAQKLYAFLAEGVESMPDFDVPRLSAFEQIKQGAGQVFDFVKKNRGDIMDAIGFIQQIRTGAPTQDAAAQPETTLAIPEIPPLPNTPQP